MSTPPTFVNADGTCLPRAISTMRLALGYEEALPPWFFREDYNVTDLWFFRHIKACFPEHRVRFWEDSETCTQEELDGHLIAFAYQTDRAAHKSHIVIGAPARIEGKEMPLLLVFSVGE